MLINPRHAVAISLRGEMLLDFLWNWKAHLLPNPATGERCGVVTLPDLEAARLPDGSRLVIPQDAKVIGVYSDLYRGCITLLLEHPDLPLWPDGDLCATAHLSEFDLRVLPATQAGPDAPVVVE